MVKNVRFTYICQNCGYQTPKWLGKCPDCGQWDSITEEIFRNPEKGFTSPNTMSDPMEISRVKFDPDCKIKTGIDEFDRAIGGGIVPGSLLLLGGEPGIGKSTLVLQVAGKLSQQNCKTIYLSGEESAQQIKLRAQRLSTNSDNLFIITGTKIEDLFDKIKDIKTEFLVIDSIQTIYTETIPSAPGSVGQIREVAGKLLRWSKEKGIPTFLIGHITKEGSIAGPKILEHLVDTVLYFEGDRSHTFRIIRTVKNRYGSTNEIGVFEMKENGLVQVGNPSRIFLEERPENASGSIVIPCLEGTRPLLLEIQALVCPSPFGMPRRTAIGVDHNRISLLVAVLSKRVGIELGDQDIFVNVAGGLRVDEPAADLGIVTAMISSFLNKSIDYETVMFGEVGLAGEVRGVVKPEDRIKEAEKMKFTRCIMSKSNFEGCKTSHDIKMFGINSLSDIMDILF